MALADEPFEAYPPIDDEDEQFGLGRGLGAILGHHDEPRDGDRGVNAFFPHAGGVLRAAPATTPPLPRMPGPANGALVEPVEAPRRQAINSHLSTLTDELDLDLAVHLRPGPGGGWLSLLRPNPRALSAPDMDGLCRTIREFVAGGRPTTDDLVAGGCRCVAFGPRPLTEAGVYVLGRRGAALTLDERWTVHQRLAAAPATAS